MSSYFAVGSTTTSTGSNATFSGTVTGANLVATSTATSPAFISNAADGTRGFGHATYPTLFIGFASNLLGLYATGGIQLGISTNLLTSYAGGISYNLTQANGTGAAGFDGYQAQVATLSGASTTLTLNAPTTGCVLREVSYRVTTTVTGSGITGWNLGDTGSVRCDGAAVSATSFGSAKALTAGTTGTLADCTVNLPIAYKGSVTFTFTPVGAATFTGGAVRLVYRYETLSAPTA